MSLSICDHCNSAKPKPLCCRDCPLVETCPNVRMLPGPLSNRFCPHLDHDYIKKIGSSEGIVKKCPDFGEEQYGQA